MTVEGSRHSFSFQLLPFMLHGSFIGKQRACTSLGGHIVGFVGKLALQHGSEESIGRRHSTLAKEIRNGKVPG